MRVALEKPQFVPCCHRHHVYGGSRRKWSEKYNAVIYLPPYLHNMSNEGIHFNKRFRLSVQERYQRMLEEAGWTREEFIETFGRSYL